VREQRSPRRWHWRQSCSSGAGAGAGGEACEGESGDWTGEALRDVVGESELTEDLFMSEVEDLEGGDPGEVLKAEKACVEGVGGVEGAVMNWRMEVCCFASFEFETVPLSLANFSKAREAGVVGGVKVDS